MPERMPDIGPACGVLLGRSRIIALQHAVTAPASVARPTRRIHIGDAVFAGVARFSGAFVLILLGAIIVDSLINPRDEQTSQQGDI